MVMSFRVSELQVLLGFAGRNKSGRKHELLAKALHLLKSSCAPSVQMKIKELYRRRFPRKTLGPSDLSLLSLPPGTPPVGSPGPLAPIPPALLAPGTLLGPKREVDMHPPLPQPVHPDVTMKPLPFYEIYGELIRPTTLASTSSQRFEEAHFTFALTPQQVQQILTSRYVSLSPPASSLGGYPETLLSDFLLFFFAPFSPSSCTCSVPHSLVCLVSIPWTSNSLFLCSPLCYPPGATH